MANNGTDNNAPNVIKSKYSQKELEEFKAIILEKLEKARADLELLTEAYSNNNEHDTRDTSPPLKFWKRVTT